MLGRTQIETLLLETEGLVGIRLDELRKRLLRQKNYDATIFELVVLHQFALRFDEALPESGESKPDITVGGDEGFSVEVTLASKRDVTIEKTEDHPFYRAIRNKGQQISRWGSEVSVRPLCVVIGSFGSSPQFSTTNHANLALSAERAIWKAILDPGRLSTLEAANVGHQPFRVGSRGWDIKRPPSRLLGSRYISCIVWCRFDYFQYAPRIALYPNRHCDRELSADTIDKICSITFEPLYYANKLQEWRPGNRELHFMGGAKLRMSLDKRDEDTIEISSRDVLLLLSGKKTAAELLGDPLVSIIGERLLDKRDIVSIELRTEKEKLSEHNDVIFKFGPPLKSIVADKKGD